MFNYNKKKISHALPEFHFFIKYDNNLMVMAIALAIQHYAVNMEVIDKNMLH